MPSVVGQPGARGVLRAIRGLDQIVLDDVHRPGLGQIVCSRFPDDETVVDKAAVLPQAIQVIFRFGPVLTDDDTRARHGPDPRAILSLHRYRVSAEGSHLGTDRKTVINSCPGTRRVSECMRTSSAETEYSTTRSPM